MTCHSKLRAKYFALASEMGFESEFIKGRAKQFFKVESFNDLDNDQVELLIDKLYLYARTRGLLSKEII